MRKDRVRAYELRRQSKSYSEISKTLGIPKGTLAGWFKDEDWSREIREVLGAKESLAYPEKLAAIRKANKERWRLKYEEYQNAAIQEFEEYKDNPLFLAGIMLYWGEGEKQPRYSVVRLTSSEPEMIKIFNLFLTRVLKISADKISARLLLYPDLIDSVQKNFWSKSTGLFIDQFKKSTYLKGHRSNKRLSYGVCATYIQSRELKERMLKWLELYQDYLRSHVFKLEKQSTK